jgi:lipopolysaccharide export system protein LptA
MVRMMQQTGDAVASGNVAATFVGAGARVGGSASGSGVTHVLAQEAVLHRTAQTMELKGTDAAPARMWQGASQVEAANLLLDRGKDSMQAWPAAATGVVRSVFAGSRETVDRKEQTARDQAHAGDASLPGAGKKNKLSLSDQRVVRVTSGRLDYSGVSHEAVFTGGVTAEGEDGQVRAQRAVAFLSEGPGSRGQGPEGQGTARQGATARQGGAKGQPDPVAGSLERIVMSGGVKVEQPGRTATGEQLLYTAATGEFVLTGTPGHPPHVVDDKQGSITGATLLFHSPDSTIVVAGEPASRRVHTETTIKK